MDRVKGAAQLLRGTVGPARHCVESGHPLLCGVLKEPAEAFSTLSTDNLINPFNDVLSRSNRTLGEVVAVLETAEDYQRMYTAAAQAIVAGQPVDEFIEQWQGTLDDVEKVLHVG
jgi:hypothetical protein